MSTVNVGAGDESDSEDKRTPLERAKRRQSAAGGATTTTTTAEARAALELELNKMVAPSVYESAEARKYMTDSFIVQIELHNVIEPSWVRKVRVPGNISLWLFQDKLVLPLFGLERRGAGYFYRQRSLPTNEVALPATVRAASVVFGATSAIDARDKAALDIYVVNDKRLRLAHVLNPKMTRAQFYYNPSSVFARAFRHCDVH